MSGNAGRGRSRRTYIDHIGEVLQKSEVRSTRNRRACMVSVLSESLFYANAIETCMTFGAPIGPFGILNQ